VLVLRSVRAQKLLGQDDAKEDRASTLEKDVDWEKLNRDTLGVKCVRGAEVIHVMDETKSVIGERDKEGKVHRGIGSLRTYYVELDSAQYQIGQCLLLAFSLLHLHLTCVVVCALIPLPPALADQTHQLENEGSEDVYTTFNLVMRRKPEENNFKAVLLTIRDLMDSK
jgi:intron-binding protein aquarius